MPRSGARSPWTKGKITTRRLASSLPLASTSSREVLFRRGAGSEGSARTAEATPSDAPATATTAIHPANGARAAPPRSSAAAELPTGGGTPPRGSSGSCAGTMQFRPARRAGDRPRGTRSPGGPSRGRSGTARVVAENARSGRALPRIGLVRSCASRSRERRRRRASGRLPRVRPPRRREPRPHRRSGRREESGRPRRATPLSTSRSARSGCPPARTRRRKTPPAGGGIKNRQSAPLRHREMSGVGVMIIRNKSSWFAEDEGRAQTPAARAITQPGSDKFTSEHSGAASGANGTKVGNGALPCPRSEAIGTASESPGSLHGSIVEPMPVLQLRFPEIQKEVSRRGCPIRVRLLRSGVDAPTARAASRSEAAEGRRADERDARPRGIEGQALATDSSGSGRRVEASAETSRDAKERYPPERIAPSR